jgi:hypothetical protein
MLQFCFQRNCLKVMPPSSRLRKNLQQKSPNFPFRWIIGAAFASSWVHQPLLQRQCDRLYLTAPRYSQDVVTKVNILTGYFRACVEYF